MNYFPSACNRGLKVSNLNASLSKFILLVNGSLAQNRISVMKYSFLVSQTKVYILCILGILPVAENIASLKSQWIHMTIIKNLCIKTLNLPQLDSIAHQISIMTNLIKMASNPYLSTFLFIKSLNLYSHCVLQMNCRFIRTSIFMLDLASEFIYICWTSCLYWWLNTTSEHGLTVHIDRDLVVKCASDVVLTSSEK